jgi:hypothetical protein
MRLKPQRGVLTPAQGNALGKRPAKRAALKGRPNFRAPFQGFPPSEYTQGVALGWHGSPLRRSLRKGFFFQSVILSGARRMVLLAPGGGPERSRRTCRFLPRMIEADSTRSRQSQSAALGRGRWRSDGPSRSGHLGPSTPAQPNAPARHISLSPSLRMTELFLRNGTFAETSFGTTDMGDRA